jgi:hypothetical protein
MTPSEVYDPLASFRLIVQGKVTDWLLNQLSRFALFEVVELHHLHIDQITGPALQLLQRMRARQQYLEAWAMLNQVAQHAEHRCLTKAPFGERVIQRFELVQHQ